jgi:hypothetical protein
MIEQSNKWLRLIKQMGDQLSACEHQTDQTDEFVAANYDLLREHGFSRC